MTQDEQRIEEAARSIRQRAGEEIPGWAEEAIQEVLEAHSRRLQQDQSLADRQSLMRKGLEESVNHRIKRRILERAIEEIEHTGLFAKEQLLSIQRDVALALEELTVAVPVKVPGGLSILEPARTSVAIAMASFLGVFLANQIQSKGALPLLAALIFSMIGGFLLIQLQKKAIHTPDKKDFTQRIFGWLSIHTASTQDWLTGPRETVEETIGELSDQIALLVRYAARLQLRDQEDRSEEMDILQHLFHKCTDGFAEVYYAELKRDPERALDACIKLVGDLQNAGVEIDTVEKRQPYQEELTSAFEVTGRIEEGEPVLMIHPSWRYQGRLLTKGTLKRARK